MILNHIILAVLWIVYCALHSLLASQWIKSGLQKRMKNHKIYRLYYTVFAFLFFAALLYYQMKIPTVELFASTKLILIVGGALSISGLGLMIICIRKYFMSLSGLRSLLIENYSNELKISGIHRYVRHPLYLGTFVFIWGLLLLFPYLSLLIANIIITAYTLIGIELEEQKLVTEFGEHYVNYCRNVPKLIPFLKPRRAV
jgi:protein-S-isoprenylcysteine O-methyltransferase Ste14